MKKEKNDVKTHFSERLDRALAFAAEAHKNQVRKTDPGIPYIFHPTHVGLLLLKAGFEEDVVIAGILHDVVEDTPYTNDDIKKKFGARIARIVANVTENKKLSWEERKACYLEMVLASDDLTKAVSVADKLHNVRSLTKALRQKREIWQYFKKDKETTVAHYANFAQELKKTWQHPLLDELATAVEVLVQIAGTHASEPDS